MWAFSLKNEILLTRHPRTAVVLSAFLRNEHILSELHYNVDGIDPNDQPLKALWDEQFSQWVHYNCLHPNIRDTLKLATSKMVGHWDMTPAPVMMNDGKNGIWHI